MIGPQGHRLTHGLRERLDAFREREIIRTAGAIVADVGCRSFTMSQVAAALGISKATLYVHFRGREELLRRVVGESCRAVLERARRGVEQLPPQQRLERAARDLVERCMGMIEDEDDPGPPCCLAESECPYMDWNEVDRLLSELDPERGRTAGPGTGRALRALSAAVLHQRKAEGRRPAPSDAEAVVRLLLPSR